MTNQKTYFPHIDGLRAISVLLVILYHINPILSPGGFVGVDVFFVISGYLITKQITEALLENRFSLINFYLRRVKRILPPVYFVLLFTLAMGYCFYLPADLESLTISVSRVLTVSSNLYFAKMGGYFDANVDTQPLLHTWSLAIEEQFYLIFPIALIIVFKKAPKHLGRFLIAALILSFAYSNLQLLKEINWAYYSLSSRAWEMLIGGCLAFYGNKLKHFQRQEYAYIGLALIFISAYTLNKTSLFPGINALWPCLGAALFITSYSKQKGLLLLESKTSSTIGKLSFSLYLWHWPLIVFIRFLFPNISEILFGISVLTFSFVLSNFTYSYIEKPLHEISVTGNAKKIFLGLFCLPSMLLTLLYFSVMTTDGFKNRLLPETEFMYSAANSMAHILREQCHVDSENLPSDHCNLGIKKASPDGVLWGDSHANHYSGLVDKLGQNLNLSFRDITHNSCPPFLGHEFKRKTCKTRNDNVAKLIQTSELKFVIIAGSWSSYDLEFLEENLSKTINFILETNKIPILIGVIPYLPTKYVDCDIKNSFLPKGLSQQCDIPISESGKFLDQEGLLNKLQIKYKKLVVINPEEILCTELACLGKIDDLPVYRLHDNSHLNMRFSEFLGDRYSKFTQKKILEIQGL